MGIAKNLHAVYNTCQNTYYDWSKGSALQYVIVNRRVGAVYHCKDIIYG